jgi:hypothetical protein
VAKLATNLTALIGFMGVCGFPAASWARNLMSDIFSV